MYISNRMRRSSVGRSTIVQGPKSEPCRCMSPSFSRTNKDAQRATGNKVGASTNTREKADSNSGESRCGYRSETQPRTEEKINRPLYVHARTCCRRWWSSCLMPGFPITSGADCSCKVQVIRPPHLMPTCHTTDFTDADTRGTVWAGLACDWRAQFELALTQTRAQNFHSLTALFTACHHGECTMSSADL
jgi:hypothetical protein